MISVKNAALALAMCASATGFGGHDANALTGAATTYNVTLTQVELCQTAACAAPFVVGTGAKSFDIASANVGASLGSYAPVNSVPKGKTITHVRVTMSRTINIGGQTADPGNVGGTCDTNSGDASSNTTTAGNGTVGGGVTTQTLVVPDETSIAGQPPAGTYAAQDLTLTSATEMQVLKALPAPFTMGDVPPVVDVSFETAAGIQAFDSNGGVAGGTCLMLPGVPTVSITTK